jgi:hypothetical protein
MIKADSDHINLAEVILLLKDNYPNILNFVEVEFFSSKLPPPYFLALTILAFPFKSLRISTP